MKVSTFYSAPSQSPEPLATSDPERQPIYIEMNYKKFTYDDLIESYTNLIDYSGKANPEILEEIENRGGMEKFQQAINEKKQYRKEINRIAKEVYELSNDYKDLEFVKQFVKSDILNQEDLNNLIERKFNENQKIIADRKINSKTIVGSIIGCLIGSILAFLFLLLTALFFKAFIYYLIIFAYLICYFSIRLITKQSASNIIVLVSAVIGTIISITLTFITLNFI